MLNFEAGIVVPIMNNNWFQGECRILNPTLVLDVSHAQYFEYPPCLEHGRLKSQSGVKP